MLLNFILSALRAMIPAGTPLLFGTLGEVYSERSGVLNLGVEGMMIMGAITAFGITQATENIWLGILAAALAGGLLALVHAFACITLRLNQVVSGLALTMLGLGLSGVLGRQFIGQPLPVDMPSLHIPLLSDLPILGALLFFHSKLFGEYVRCHHRLPIFYRHHPLYLILQLSYVSRPVVVGQKLQDCRRRLRKFASFAFGVNSYEMVSQKRNILSAFP